MESSQNQLPTIQKQEVNNLMTLSYQSKAEYDKAMKKKRNPAYDNCKRCGLEIHEQSWFTDEEGLHFCDEDCASAHKKEVKNR